MAGGSFDLGAVFHFSFRILHASVANNSSMGCEQLEVMFGKNFGPCMIIDFFDFFRQLI